MKTRTNEELNDIIRRWMGQELATMVNFINGKVRYPWLANAPNYCVDLNAVHVAELKMYAKDFDVVYLTRLHEVVEWEQGFEVHGVRMTRWTASATARQRAEALVRVIEGAKCSQKHECQCGGIDHPHTIGKAGCFRYMTESPILAGKHPELGCDTWKMPDEDGAITDFTLRQQRGYHQHECGCWSRSEGSFNSVDA